jgi:hypothetical protein
MLWKDIDDVLKAFALPAGIPHDRIIGGTADDVKSYEAFDSLNIRVASNQTFE